MRRRRRGSLHTARRATPPAPCCARPPRRSDVVSCLCPQVPAASRLCFGRRAVARSLRRRPTAGGGGQGLACLWGRSRPIETAIAPLAALPCKRRCVSNSMLRTAHAIARVHVCRLDTCRACRACRIVYVEFVWTRHCRLNTLDIVESTMSISAIASTCVASTPKSCRVHTTLFPDVLYWYIM
jgi:hypothetical protein